MSFEDSAGLGVNNHYGQRGIEDGVVSGGKSPVHGFEDEIVLYIKGSDFGSGTAYDVNAILPEGALVLTAVAEVNEAFVLGGTTPTINVGTKDSAGTNYGIELSEANAEATGTYDGTAAGTWGSRLTADTQVEVILDGTSPTVTEAGEAKVVIRYSKI